MKRIAWLLAVLLLMGCVPQTPVEQTAPVTVIEITAGENAAPSERPAPVEPAESSAPTETVIPESAMPVVTVLDGAAYGCDVVCFADGFGFGYAIDGHTADECRIYVEETATSDLPPLETHRLLLEIDGEPFCLGELRFDTAHPTERNAYGLSYAWVVTDSDLTELEPAEPTWPQSDRIAFLVSFDAAAKTVDVLTAARLSAGPDETLAFDPDSMSETPITLSVPETALLAIVNDEGATMRITRDRFFALLEMGYIGFLPSEDEDLFVGCGVGYDGDTLLVLYEIG